MADRKSVVQVKFRLRKDMLRRLEQSAKKTDRSVNDEISRRLEQSLDQTNALDSLLGGPATSRLLLTLALAIKLVEIQKGKLWHEDYSTLIHAKYAIRGVMDRVVEPPNTNQESPIQTLMESSIAEAAAADAVAEVQKAIAPTKVEPPTVEDKENEP